jgi:6-phosphogluconolactonase
VAYRLRVLYVLIAAAVLIPDALAQSSRIVYIGTYTRQNSKGIYAYRFQPSTGKLTDLGLAAETSNPSWVTVHPNGKFLYAANENRQGTITAFSIDPETGKLTMLNQVSSQGSGPCHLAIDKSGKWLFVANYNNGTIAAYAIAVDGKLGEAVKTVKHSGSSVNPQRQAGPHAHSVNPSPDGKFLLVTDLGLDQILTYHIGPGDAMLKPADPPFVKAAPGAGPRHFAYHPKGKFAYVCNEMASTATAYRYNAAKGSLDEIQTVSILPKGVNAPNNSAAEIAVHPNGRFLYASNRGHNSIAVFSIDAAKGTLTPVDDTSTQGSTPRDFTIDPTGAYLFAANQDGGGVVVFRIDTKTGKLTPTGEKLDVAFPVCVAFR